MKMTILIQERTFCALLTKQYFTGPKSMRWIVYTLLDQPGEIVTYDPGILRSSTFSVVIYVFDGIEITSVLFIFKN